MYPILTAWKHRSSAESKVHERRRMNTRNKAIVALGLMAGLSQCPIASAQAVDPVTAIAYRLAPMALPLAASVISAAVPVVANTTLFGARAFALTVRAGSLLPAYAKERMGEIPRPHLFHRDPEAPAPKVAYVPKGKVSDDNPSKDIPSEASAVADPSWSTKLTDVSPANAETEFAKSSVSAVVQTEQGQALTETTSAAGTVDGSTIQEAFAEPGPALRGVPESAETAEPAAKATVEPAQVERVQVRVNKKEPSYSSADVPVVMHKAKSDGHGGWLRAD